MADSYHITLYQLGLAPYAGPADGVDGPQTQAGVRIFQEGTGNPHVDGELGTETYHYCQILQAGLALGGPCSVDGVYGPQSNGACRHAQDALRDHGSDPGGTDGVPGNQWIGAVRDFQQKNGLVVDGLFGVQTGSALFGAPRPPAPGPGPSGTFSGQGVDVYEGNGDIFWPAVANSGRNGSYVKVNEGTGMDSRFTNGRVQAMDQAGERLGGYDFIRVRIDRSGADEARMFLDRMRAMGGGTRPGDLVPVADFEVSNGFGPQTCFDYLGSWLQEVNNQMGIACVYVSPGIWAAITPGPVGATFVPGGGAFLWVAHYGVSSPSIPVAWNHWDGWQYTSGGSVPGISPPTDLDHWASMGVHG